MDHQKQHHGASHGHYHSHGNNHSHGEKDGDAEKTISDREKLLKLLEHWVSHNNDHAGNYMQWSEKAAGMGLNEASKLLAEAAELTNVISERFIEAKEAIKIR